MLGHGLRTHKATKSQGGGSDELELLDWEARSRHTPQNSHIERSLSTGVDLGLTKVHHILPLPELVDSPLSKLLPLRFADFLLTRVFGFAALHVSLVRSLYT